ncbi:MFS transporter [Ferviditalea candida]|uniref:MFS transporter n=1 Tax=Ferviditalea candida TaxID=3108399 RepID=A0ABU5ZKT8_9BACL|nr:MFS transporter [Paenibacillaceae bacterium T2]
MNNRHKRKTRFGLNSTIVVLGLVSLFTDLSSEMIIPVLPLFLTSVLHVQAGAIGVIEGLAESTASVLKLFSGWFSDRIGKRKPLMVFGYGLSNLVKPLFAVSASWGQVLGIRLADRFGKGLRGAPRDALLADVTTPADRGRAFGIHRAMDTLGAAIGPFSAFWILAVFDNNYRAVFWFSAIPGVLAVALLVFLLKERKAGAHGGSVGEANVTDLTNGEAEKNEAPQADTRGEKATAARSPQPLPKIGFKQLSSKLKGFTLAATVFALGNSSDAFLILRAQDAGMAAVWIPLAYFAFNITYTLFSVPAGMLSDRIGRRPVIVAGYLIFALIYLGFGLASNAGWIWVLFIVYGVYYAATEGIQKAYVGDLAEQGGRGLAMGTFNALTGLAALPASIISGALWQMYGPMAAFGFSSALAVAAAGLMVFMKV